jgi:prepilin-type N-terminal cleavage/methylation domain-containing protein
MKQGEKGFSYIELLIAATIISLVAGAAAITAFQVFPGTERNNNYITAVHQVQSAGFWISRDSQMAQTIMTDNLTSPDFLVINWTDWDDPTDPVYHSATYFFADLTDGIGKLKRTHWSSAGASEETLVAEHIYYAPGDPDDTSQVSYQAPVLTVQLTALAKDTMETREYKISHRINF